LIFLIVGFGIGAFFSLMSASFAYEDPYLRQQTQAGLNTAQKAREVFREMGKGMWKSGKGFGKVGALFAGIECVIESVRLFFSFLFPFAAETGWVVSREK
jgi:import inner membrane translocase subunit TIM22